MSFRVWIGEKPEIKHNLYDFRLDEYENDLGKLAKAAAWKCPLRIYGKDQKRIMAFLRILDEEYSMSIDDISQVKVVD